MAREPDICNCASSGNKAGKKNETGDGGWLYAYGPSVAEACTKLKTAA